jgi:iron complex outermembrane receptor protein
MQRHRLLACAILAALAPPSLVHAADAPADPVQLDAVSVIGQGQTRQVQRIGVQDQAVLPPGTSPQKLLGRIPGVNVQSNDAFGANEESQSIQLRGYGTTQLGYTLDGLPLGNNAYGAFNGLNISRALIAENFGGAELAVGIGNVGTASTSNLGGTVQYYSDDPAPGFGGRFGQTFGSDSNRRTYLRVDTGEHNGFSAYLSGIDARADMWARPHSPTWTRQFNGKAVWQNDAVKLTAFVDTSRTSQADYAYLSKSGLARGLGWDWNLYAPDWERALAAAYCASATYDAAKCGYSGGVDNIDDAYYQSRALRKDDLYYLAGDFAFSDTVSARAQVYHHKNEGQGHWWAPGQKSNPGTPQELPISIRSTNYYIDRSGALASLAWQLGAHRLEAGAWYEHNDHDIERNFYWIDGPVSDDKYLRDPDRRLFRQDYTIVTRQLYLQDSFRLLDDRLAVDLGVKSPHNSVKAVAAQDVESPYASGRIKAGKALLPQAGVGWQLGGGHELFASYAQNLSAFTTGPLSVSQASFDDSRGNLRPEESTTFEGGWRYAGGPLQASVALYHTTFGNRLLSLNPCASILVGTPGCITRYYNVGSVKSRGAEATVVWKPARTLEWYNSASWNKSTYEDDYQQGGAVVPIAGKRVVGIPETMFASELSWRWNGWNASLRGKYVGKRYYTYTNDQGFGGVTSFDAGAGYDFGQVGFLHGLRVALNVTNLTDKRYAADLSAYTNTDPAGRALAFHASAPRQAFLTVDAKF